MKIYTFEDSLFCYLCVIIANSKEDAYEIAQNKGVPFLNLENFEEHEIENGFVIEGGGNG